MLNRKVQHRHALQTRAIGGSLRMGDNPYNDIDSELKKLSGLKNLVSLQLFNLNLGRVPVGVFELTGLEFLNLIYNQIDSIPEGFERMTSLKGLWLYDYKPLLTLKDIKPLRTVLPRGCEVKYTLERIK